MNQRLIPAVGGLLAGIVLGVVLAYLAGFWRMRQLERRMRPARELTQMANLDIKRAFPDARILDVGVVSPSLTVLEQGINGTYDVEVTMLRGCKVRTFTLQYSFRSRHAIPKSDSELETAWAKGFTAPRGCGEPIAPSQITPAISLRITP